MSDSTRLPERSPQPDRTATTPAPTVILVMGVSGCGKSSVGQALAQRLGSRFVDADDFHPPANVDKMRAGIPLNDQDRQPWLERLNALLRHSVARKQPVVLACSALRARYRELLAHHLRGLVVVHLRGDYDLIAARLAARQHRYMPASLLRSQFDTLEPPPEAIEIDVRDDVGTIVNSLIARLAD